MHVLRVVTTEDDSEAALYGLIDTLTCTPLEAKLSTTVYFKVTPFQNNDIGRDGITELITRQNNLLHNTMATSVVDGGNFRQHIENKRRLIAEIFYRIERRTGCTCFIRLNQASGTNATFYIRNTCKKMQDFLDNLCNHLLQGYGLDYCKGILGGRSRSTGGAGEINTKDSGVPLKFKFNVGHMVQKQKAGLLLPLKKELKKVPTLVFSKMKGSVWGARLHDVEDATTTGASNQHRNGVHKEDTSTFTQESLAPTVFTLDSDLNTKIQEANKRSKADAAITKRELEKIEVRISNKLTGMTTRLAL